MQLSNQLTVNATADQVWQLLAHDFADIGEWASGVAKSRVHQTAEIPQDATVGGRVCTVPGFGEIEESFIVFDDSAKTFTYEAIGMPFFVRSAHNSWVVTPLDANTTAVRFEVDLKLMPIIGGLMSIPMKRQMTKLLSNATEELKYYIETGTPHPRKKHVQSKLMASSAVAGD